MKVICCPLTAAMTANVATARKAALIMCRLYWRKSADPLAKNRDKWSIKLNCGCFGLFARGTPRLSMRAPSRHFCQPVSCGVVLACVSLEYEATLHIVAMHLRQIVGDQQTR